MMTVRQRQALKFLADEQAAGRSPSYEQIAAALNPPLRSKSNVTRLVRGLEQRGFIRRLPGRARTIEVLRGRLT
jgi:repressor LexA